MTETHVNNDDPGNNAARTRLNEARSGVSATVIRSDSGRSTDLTGQTISGYRITEALNTAAGEADLYKCHKAANPGAGTYVFKIFRRENAIKESVVRKLLSERSPYVAPLEQYGIHGGRQFIVLPYYERPSLAEELRRGKRYSGQELRSVIIPSVIEGLRIIHDLGILHKDVKPANLIPDNTGKRIVLIDFGISSDTGGQTLVVTRTGMTPFYAAPEAIQGIFHKETDYYALGITIFELFTGFTPFQNAGLSEQDVMRLASLNQISFPEGFPEDLRNLVLGLTYKDLSHRNDPENPHRRWGYEEVRRWLRGEQLPVPGTGTGFAGTPAGPEGFQPYNFQGVSYTREEDFIKALLKNRRQAFNDLGRGLLSCHYYRFSRTKGDLCAKAEELVAGNTVPGLRILYSLLYSLLPSLKTVFCGNQEFQDIDDLIRRIFDKTVMETIRLRDLGTSDDPEITGFDMLLSSGALEEYAEKAVNNPSLAGILERVRNEAAEQDSNLKLCLMAGYALSDRRAVVIDGTPYENPQKLQESLAVIRERDRQGYIALLKRIKPEIEFYARHIRDDIYRKAFQELIEDQNSAVFGNNEYFFRNGDDFKLYLSRCLENNRLKEVRYISEKFGNALRAVSRDVWHSDAFVYLSGIISKMVFVGTETFAGTEEFRIFADNLKRNPADLRIFLNEHRQDLEGLRGRSDIGNTVAGLLNSGNDGPDAGSITAGGVRYSGNDNSRNQPRPPGTQQQNPPGSTDSGTPAGNSPVDGAIRAGSTITFGNYFQNDSRSKTPIEWLVLEVFGDNTALVISKYILDVRPYYHQYGYVTWESCSLRRWLNEDFLDETFSESEKRRISLSTVLRDDNQQFQISGGEDTRDRIFCLNVPEVNRYFPDSASRICQATDYADGHNSGRLNNWWLRTPGNAQNHAVYVDFKGKLDLRGLTISEIAGVRPAMIVPLNAPEITVNSQKDSPEQNSHSSHERPVPDPAGSQTYRNGQRSNPENMSARGNPESPVRRPNSGTGNSDPENVALDAIRPPGDAASGNSPSPRGRNSDRDDTREAALQSGNTITFGNYFHNDNRSRTPIEWLVLEVFDNNTALVVSKYILDFRSYHHRGENVTWENCSLRKWLNGDFLNETFSETEKRRITLSAVRNDDNVQFQTSGGDDTRDRIFCLNVSEVTRYFPDSASRTAEATAYASDQNATDLNNWWLRTPGSFQNHVVYMNFRGRLELMGHHASLIYGIRPAMIVSLAEPDSTTDSPEADSDNSGNSRKAPPVPPKNNEPDSTTDSPEAGSDNSGNSRKVPQVPPKSNYSSTDSNPEEYETGHIVRFGQYFIDASGVRAPLDWIVLRMHDNQALLICRNIIDVKPFHYQFNKITWEQSSLRKWLNREFLRTAFSSVQRDRIIVSTVYAEMNPEYCTPGGRNTSDMVFCLSLNEINCYFGHYSSRAALPTPYAESKGSFELGDDWWTRTPGQYLDEYATIQNNGSVWLQGSGVTNTAGVRPALWVVIDKDQESRFSKVFRGFRRLPFSIKADWF